MYKIIINRFNCIIIINQAGHFLLGLYGFRGTMLLFGAWSLHAVVGGCLLRPLKINEIKSDKSEVK